MTTLTANKTEMKRAKAKLCKQRDCFRRHDRDFKFDALTDTDHMVVDEIDEAQMETPVDQIAHEKERTHHMFLAACAKDDLKLVQILFLSPFLNRATVEQASRTSVRPSVRKALTTYIASPPNILYVDDPRFWGNA